MKAFLLGIAGLLLRLLSLGVFLLSMIWFYYDLGFEKVVIVALAFIASAQLWNGKWMNKF